MKRIWIDVETTGTDNRIHSLIQVAGVVDVDNREQVPFDFLMAPRPGTVIEDEALEVNGRKREEIEGFESHTAALGKFQKMLARYVNKYQKGDKFYFIGYNARFDADFIRAWFEANGDQYFGSWFFFPPIDVMNEAASYLMHKREMMKDFKLATVAAEFGLQADGLHDAQVDIRLTQQLFYAVQRARIDFIVKGVEHNLRIKIEKELRAAQIPPDPF